MFYQWHFIQRLPRLGKTLDIMPSCVLRLLMQHRPLVIHTSLAANLPQIMFELTQSRNKVQLANMRSQWCHQLAHQVCQDPMFRFHRSSRIPSLAIGSVVAFQSSLSVTHADAILAMKRGKQQGDGPLRSVSGCRGFRKHLLRDTTTCAAGPTFDHRFTSGQAVLVNLSQC